MSEQRLRTENLGVWSDPFEFKVERDRTVAYAKATNDANPVYLEGETAPPVFAIVPVFEGMIGPLFTVVPDSLIPFVVHGEQDMVFHRPIEPGATLVSRAMVTGFSSKRSGRTVSVKLETRTASPEGAGDLVVEQWMVSFFRGFQAGEDAGEVAPPHPFPEELRDAAPVAEVVQHVDDDQTFRYAEASGDPMPIHLDEEFAKSAGLPGIIAHGLCTMAFTSRAVIESVAAGDPRRLRRLAVRFSKPVLPGEDVTTRIWDAGGGAYAFETTSGSGDVVIKDGRAEIG
ncbi:MaoC/PaaZ C-terminal domain-containing protein [Actinomadura parmotrematis]|uniref:MaoC family dehydratase N-terminal domain-containing protein n=1 Tax=Actinomadura parmotrematis TaxID=2864039 RepID=A0ABS7FRJ1_9ACTN|nr:MaoC/PaaZ C-terminal domain-containing protein [Actinomadura parmotrematis]MBW8483014.1 MaoC family dehydratase N-terminal domain-containing protein [Actinomadura parmotrematis]